MKYTLILLFVFLSLSFQQSIFLKKQAQSNLCQDCYTGTTGQCQSQTNKVCYGYIDIQNQICPPLTVNCAPQQQNNTDNNLNNNTQNDANNNKSLATTLSLNKLFGPYIFIYDGKTYSSQKGLIGGVPSWVKTGGANIVILAFLDPIELQQSSTLPQQFQDALTSLKGSNINVQISMGGYDLAQNFQQTDPITVANNAAAITQQYGVGFEIDVESDNDGQWVDTFIKQYRSKVPYSSNPTISQILTMDLGASPGAFPSLTQAASNNINLLDWINLMVYDPEISPDNRQFWNLYNLPANKITVARNLINTCNNYADLSPTLTYQKNNQEIRGILFWAGLSEQTCNNAQQGAYFCGTGCSDCTAGIKSGTSYDCPALKQACASYVGQCSS